MDVTIIDPYSFVGILTGALWINILAIIAVGVAEVVSAKLCLSREPFAAIIVIVSVATVLRILTLAPAGSGVLQEPLRNTATGEKEATNRLPGQSDHSHFASAGFVTPELTPRLSATLALSLVFLVLSLAIAVSRGERISSLLRFIFVLPFIFFIVQVIGWIC
jgi:hypothetical protein